MQCCCGSSLYINGSLTASSSLALQKICTSFYQMRIFIFQVSVICWTTFQGFAFFKKFVQILGHSRFLDIVTNPWVSVGICAGSFITDFLLTRQSSVLVTIVSAIPIALTVILWLADNEFFVRSDS